MPDLTELRTEQGVDMVGQKDVEMLIVRILEERGRRDFGVHTGR